MADLEQKVEQSDEKGTKQEAEELVGVDAIKASDAKKSPKKSAAKSPAKAKPKPKKEASHEEDESDDEELVGSLDKPLVVEGKRDRKSTEFLVTGFKSPQNSERKQIIIPEGKGETLGSMPRVQFQLGRMVAVELKPLHKALFGRPGVNSEVKKNIRSFNGFDFEKGSKEYIKKVESVDRFTLDGLKRVAEILDVEKKGKKEELLERVMDFLMEPKASGLAVKTKKKTSKKSGTKRKRGKKETKSSKKKSEETAESDDEEDEAEEEEEEEEKPPPKKQKVSETKKESKKGKKETKKTPKKDKKVVPIKISPGKKGRKEKAAKHDSDSSDDEPLVKKKKKSPPTDDEIASLVKELLDGADLEKITMKSVCKQVFDRFPDFDLSPRKDFIKETVKEIIT